MTKGENVRDYGYHKEYFKVMTDFGMNLNTHQLYKDEPNAHVVLNLPRIIPDSVSSMNSIWSKFTESQQAEMQTRYNPVRYLKFKDKNHIAWNDKNVDYSYARPFTSA
jgi:hypothetical protein